MSLSAAHLHAALIAHLPQSATGLVVALSGGADSSALLAGIAALRGQLSLPLRAVHIDHGLQTAAVELRNACQAQCAQLKVPLTVIAVQIAAQSGESLEAAARDARYAALARELERGECLLSAHHADDQAETVLLQSLRGAGLKGLAAMPARRPLGEGWHLRPLLEVPRRDLRRFGRELGAAGVEDPMNQDRRFDRNFLRHELWPKLETRWPGAATALSRTARHAAEAQELLEAAAALDMARLRDGAALSVPGLRTLDPARRALAVRLWLHEAGVRLPSEARIAEALRQILEAEDDHLPAILWGEHALRRYRQRLFLTEAAPPLLRGVHHWQLECETHLVLQAPLGTLRCVAQGGGLDLARIKGPVSVRRREGGELLKPAAAARTQSVQHLCQEQGVLPWLRDALPYVFAGTELVAVADLWVDARWCVAANEPGAALIWENAPILV